MMDERQVSETENTLIKPIGEAKAGSLGKTQNLLFLGLTAILVGYSLVWLPGPAAGLRLIGIEIGEWIKFLGVGSGRNWFYLPPIVIGMTLALLAATWPNDRPQTWLARGLAVVAALLAFPAIAAIQMEPRGEWLFRVLMIGLVLVVTLSGALVARRSSDSPWPWLLMAIFALLGSILPTMQYVAVKPLVEEVLRRPLGVGWGVWLNASGSLLVFSMAIIEFWAAWRAAQKRQPPDGRLSSDEFDLE